MTKRSPFNILRPPEIIRLAVMVYVRFPLSLRNVEDLWRAGGVDISHETARHCWYRFALLAAEIRKRQIAGIRSIRLP